jgi:hypothetical protein
MPATPPNSVSQPDADSAQPNTATREEDLAQEDFYYEGPYLVFTAAYHLKRGYCCNSGCRHCPYRDSA